MAIPCPGSDKFSRIFGAGRGGDTAFEAWFKSMLVLIRMVQRSDVWEFLDQECEDGCEKFVMGPEWTKPVTLLRRRKGGEWSCIVGGILEAEIQCTEAVEASDEEILEEMMAMLKAKPRQKI